MPELQTVVQLKNGIVQNRMEKLLLMSTELRQREALLRQQEEKLGLKNKQ